MKSKEKTELKKNFTKLTHKGVSLIVLIVTIIVIVILAATVILTLSKNNSIESAREARFKEDVRTFQDELALAISKDYAQKAGQRDGKFNAVTVREIKNYIPSFNDLYDGKFEIVEDELQYLDNKFDDKEIKWLEELSVKKFEKGYVKEGLILHYDGIKNTRKGNNPNATTWEDLSGNNNDGKFINPNNTIKYKENGYEFTNNSDYIESINHLGIKGDMNYTIEFVYKSYGYQENQSNAGNGLFWFGTTSATTGSCLSCFLVNNITRISWMNSGINVSMITNDSKKHTISFRKKIGYFNLQNIIFVIDNVYDNNFTCNSSYSNIISSPIQLGRGWQWGNQNRTLNGIIFSVRIYNRVLSDDEIKQNYEVDKKRYNIK